MDEFEKILLFMTSGTNTLSLPSQTEQIEKRYAGFKLKFSII